MNALERCHGNVRKPSEIHVRQQKQWTLSMLKIIVETIRSILCPLVTWNTCIVPSRKDPTTSIGVKNSCSIWPRQKFREVESLDRKPQYYTKPRSTNEDLTTRHLASSDDPVLRDLTCQSPTS